ncbi:MAG TPA: hypothetical protein VIH85_12750 [Solirubrobacteraceae bacterium]|jgi:hypothetical protein
MSYRVLQADDAFWRPSNQMGVLNTDPAKQLEASSRPSSSSSTSSSERLPV